MFKNLCILCTCFLFNLPGKAQDSTLKNLKPITMQHAKGSSKIFFYGNQQIKEKEIAPYLLKFNASAYEYKKSRNNQTAIYYVMGSVVLLDVAGIATLKRNESLSRGLMLTAAAGLGVSIYLVTRRNKHRNNAIKLYNQSIL